MIVPTNFPRANAISITGSPSLIRRRFTNIGITRRLSASAIERHPTNTPAHNPKTDIPTYVTGNRSTNKINIFPNVPPSMIIFSNPYRCLAVPVRWASLGITSNIVIKANTPADTIIPKLSPRKPSTIFLINIDRLPLSGCRFQHRLIHLFFIGTHFDLDRSRIIFNIPFLKVVIKNKDSDRKPDGI